MRYIKNPIAYYAVGFFGCRIEIMDYLNMIASCISIRVAKPPLEMNRSQVLFLAILFLFQLKVIYNLLYMRDFFLGEPTYFNILTIVE